MGQAASNLDVKPKIEDFTYERARARIDTFGKADKDNINVDRVNAAHLEASSSEESDGEDSYDDDDESSDGGRSRRRRKEKRVNKASSKKQEKALQQEEEPKPGDEDKINEDQARQDLLAYLGIVGAHDKNLPLTWRDDPDLGRTISTLTSDEYMRKAVAFVPCDIRVIGASSDIQPRNTGLPPQEGVRINQMTVEPGKSEGGAVTNTLLKSLYDFESEDVLVEEEDIDVIDVADNLFDDDDASNFDDDASFASLEFNKALPGAQLSWADLIRKMKNHMENEGHGKVPILTTSRKFDLTEPVHLLPPDFDHNENKKFALLVGCKYSHKGELLNSHNDVKIVKDYIINVHGFTEDDDCMTVLIDDAKHSKPSLTNITKALQRIALSSRPGDAVFIQFVGHGGRVIDINAEVDCFDEVFVPSDFKKKGLLTEKTIFRNFISRMAEDVTVTMILDSCDSGFVFDMPYAWETLEDTGETIPKLSLNHNFSYTRVLNIVKQMYQASFSAMDEEEVLNRNGGSYSDDDSDDDYHTQMGTPMIDRVGQTLKNLQMEATVEVGILTNKARRIVKGALEAAVEATEDRDSFDSDDYDDRYDDGFTEARSGSFDEGSYRSGNHSDDSYDSYQDRRRTVSRRRR